MKAGEHNEHNTRGGGSKSIPSLGRNIISLDKVLVDLNLTVKKSEYVLGFLEDDTWTVEEFQFVKGINVSKKEYVWPYVQPVKGVAVVGPVKYEFVEELVRVAEGEMKLELVPKLKGAEGRPRGVSGGDSRSMKVVSGGLDCSDEETEKVGTSVMTLGEVMVG